MQTKFGGMSKLLKSGCLWGAGKTSRLTLGQTEGLGGFFGNRHVRHNALNACTALCKIWLLLTIVRSSLAERLFVTIA